MIYDIIVIGGGISGLYCAHILSSFFNVILFEKNNYLGGRAHSDHQYHLEMGATRFSKSHVHLLQLIKRYKINIESISCRYNFLDKKKQSLTPGADIIFQNYMAFIIKKSTLLAKSQLQQLTFKKLCLRYTSLDYVNFIQNIFGYRSEFETLNAYDAIRTFKAEFVNSQYYQLTEGFSNLIEHMKKTILDQNGQIKINHEITSIKREKKYFFVNGHSKDTYKSRYLVLAINNNDLLQFPLLKPIHSILQQNIVSKPLLKIFALYKVDNHQSWFHGLEKITTDSILRQIIPINDQTGLILISYTDGDDILPFMNEQEPKSTQEITRIINNELKHLFPQLQIPKPRKIFIHYWPTGCHYWRPGVNSDIMSPELVNPDTNIYLAGEFRSQKQTWVEGGLETAYQVSNELKQHLELQQRFDKDGFLVLEKVFTPVQIRTFRNTILNYIENNSVLSHDRGISIPNFMNITELETLISIKDQPKIHHVLKKILTPHYRFCKHNDIGINRLVGWHKDKLNGKYSKYQRRNIWKPYHGSQHNIVKVLVYLQEHTHNDDGLRLVPGSHLSNVIETTHSIPIKNNIGDVIVFDQRITHRGMEQPVSRPRILISFGFGENNLFTDNFEKGTLARQHDQNQQPKKKISLNNILKN